MPGDSGAPVLNTEGKAIGIVNGGLLGGAASISWAIPLESVVWRDAVSARTRLAELALLGSRDLFAVNPDPSPDRDRTDPASGQHISAMLAAYAAKIRDLPLTASAYQKDIEAVLRLLEASPESAREHARELAIAYRLHAASLMLQGSAERSPIRAIDLAYPSLERALKTDRVFRDQNELKDAAEFFRRLLLDPPHDILLSDLLKHEFRVAMVDASSADVTRQVNATVSLNPNPITASSLVLNEINGVKGLLDKRGDVRLATIVRIGFVVGFVSRNSRFVQEHFTPTAEQLEQLKTTQEKYTSTLSGDIAIARLPAAVTQPLQSIVAELQKAPLDLKTLAQACRRLELVVQNTSK